MRFPIWYVLASDGARRYRDMTTVSAEVLRHVDPDCEVCLLSDRQSVDAASAAGIDFGRTFDRVLVSDSTDTSAMRRSRALKLRLRFLIEGDFVYVDSDTLAVAPLDDFPSISSGVAMAYDIIPGQRAHRGPPEGARALYERLGWPSPSRYFNGGVALWRNDAPAHAFAERWFKNWQESVEKGIALDQPALGHTDRQMGGTISVLPPEFNAQVHAWAGFARRARLWHFWHSQIDSTTGPSSVLDQLLLTYEGTGSVDLDLLDSARRQSYPWVRSQGFMSYVHTGNYRIALRELPRTFNRMIRRSRNEEP